MITNTRNYLKETFASDYDGEPTFLTVYHNKVKINNSQPTHS